METLNILIYIARKGGLARPVAITTSHVGDALGISQQSVSRWLITLERKGLTQRTKGIRGYIVQITPEGKRVMMRMRNGLGGVLVNCNKLIIKGKVVTGMMEGRYYIGRKGYSERIKSALGFAPFAGTLNLRLKTMDDRGYKEQLEAKKGIVIPGFEDEERAFGSLKCFPCRLRDESCAVVIPERSHRGPDTLEIISGHNLRKKLGLSDGDDVKVEVLLDENV